MDTALNILVVEDHDGLREITVEVLRNRGHNVQGVDCAESINDELGAFTPDLLVIDLNLPGEDGISLSRRIRAVQPDVGIIMVTSRKQIADKLTGYESGADLYLTKPTSVEEISAAVQALARRIKHHAQLQPAFLLNLASLSLQGPQGVVNLSHHEFAMLSALARAPNHRMEYWQLMELTSRQEADFNKSTLEVQVVRLRKKLMQAGAKEQSIKSIRGQGYQLCINVTLV